MSRFVTRCFLSGARSLVLLSVGTFVLTGCSGNTDKGTGVSTAADPAVLGEPVKGEVPTVCANCLTDEKLGETIVVQGKVIKQCPASGCWFQLKDDAGEVFVDLSPAKLLLQDDRVGQQAKVTGRVAKLGGQFRIEALHIEFTSAKKDAPAEGK